MWFSCGQTGDCCGSNVVSDKRKQHTLNMFVSLTLYPTKNPTCIIFFCSFLFDKAKRGHPISPSATVNSGADLVSIDSSIRASRDGLNDFNNSYEQNGSFSSQPHPSPQDHRRLTCSSSLPSEVSASVKSHPLLKISKSSPPPLLSYVHPKPGEKHMQFFNL